MADREGVPPYVIFHDTSLKEMSTHYPQNVSDLLMISGMGERKLRRYGDAFLREIVNYCKLHNIEPKPLRHNRPESLIKQPKTSTVQMTLGLYKQRLTMHEIAKRGIWRYPPLHPIWKNLFWMVRIFLWTALLNPKSSGTSNRH